jgi:hypothetical protein
VLPAIRIGVRSVTRRRPVAEHRIDRWVDRLLGVSKRRRQAAYLAVASAFGLLRPMIRRLAVLLAFLVVVPLVSSWLRLVF